MALIFRVLLWPQNGLISARKEYFAAGKHKKNKANGSGGCTGPDRSSCITCSPGHDCTRGVPCQLCPVLWHLRPEFSKPSQAAPFAFCHCLKPPPPPPPGGYPGGGGGGLRRRKPGWQLPLWCCLGWVAWPLEHLPSSVHGQRADLWLDIPD